jgi:hypothetical protein
MEARYDRVSENLVDVPKIECRGTLTVWPQIQDSHGKKCSDCAENKPVYSVLVHAQDNMNVDTRTHENKDTTTSIR